VRPFILGLAIVTVITAGTILATTTPRAPAAADSTGGITEEQRRELERISTLGYLVEGGPAPEASGVTRSDPDAWDGYTVYVSSDHPGAFLMDMEGRILHTWTDSLTSINRMREWTRAWVERDGSIIGIMRKPAQIRKLDRDSHLLWKYGHLDMRPHHDLEVETDGTVYVLTGRHRRLPWLREEPVIDELVCILKPEAGSVREVDCIDIAEAFRTSEFSDVLSAPWFGKDGDLFHTNSIDVFKGSIPHPAFRAGNVLLSFRSIDSIAVLDPDLRQIVWMRRGPWQQQHEARETPDGHILLFDNRPDDGQSRVVEYDVVADTIVWSYTADGFFSRGLGAEQLLPNGDVLITESERGRVIEVTRDGRIVWEYLNPSRLDGGRTIVRIPRAFRLPYDYFTGEFGEELAARRERG
jgi:hypothetical protein